MNSPVAWAILFHIFGIVFWVGGLLLVLQVMSAHAAEKSPEVRAAFSRLESKILKGFAHPGAAITVLAGAAILFFEPSYIHQTWLHAKLFLVAILIGLDLITTVRARRFQRGEIELSRGECMLLHGVISLIFLGILVMVMIKPFS